MQWLSQLSQAIDYIEEHLIGEISYEQAASIACCSPYYFQRMFSSVTGVSLSEYIRRRRMTASAFDLQNSREKVMDIALKYGYNSPTAFNRAFQSVHGVSPICARNAGTVLKAYGRINLSITVSGNESLPYRIEQKESFNVVGIKTTLSQDIEENFLLAPIFWENTLDSTDFRHICALNNREPEGILGISIFRTNGVIDYLIAAATDIQAPSELYESEIPAATWVIFECKGPYATAVQQTFRRFYREWLPFSGYEYAGLPDIEVYPLPDSQTKKTDPQVWIAVKPLRES